MNLKNCICGVIFVLCLSQLTLNKQLEFQDIIFTILSQKNAKNELQALELKSEITKETNYSSLIYITHIDLKHYGDWTVLPILPLILKKTKQKFEWVFFCSVETKVDVLKLKKLLGSFHRDNVFVGRGLQDFEPTIIHHFFSYPDFKYPLFASGFALRYSIIRLLVTKLLSASNFKKMEFSIDASHELALFIQQNLNSQLFTHSSYFCMEYKKDCVTYIKNNFLCEKKQVHIKKIYFAVKTYHKFHETRVPVVQKTWGQWTYFMDFYSDKYDKNIPTIQLKVPNTKHGHCAKTQAIIQEVKIKMDIDSNLKWVVISDDDTLFSVFRLQELLGCYSFNEPVAIGERYGYNLITNNGYNYVTGGGGVILSRKSVMLMSNNNCLCPSDSTPDDMFLFGICLDQKNITIIHVPLFHQARPNDYNKEYLKIGPPISFHKHWMVDPIKVYNEWFQLTDILSTKNKIHIELSITLIPEESEDMWHAYNLIGEGDCVRASTIRKVQNESSTGSSTSTRIRTMLRIQVENIDFDTGACVLRLKGRNIQENQYVKMGAYHTLDLELNRKFELTKNEWDSVSLERVDMACDPTQNADLAAVVMQEGLAHICLVTSSMTLIRAKIDQAIPRKRKGNVQQHEKGLAKFFENVMQGILRHVNFDIVKCILIASPGFVKDQFFEFMFQQAVKNDNKVLLENKGKFVLVHSSSGFKHSLKEVLSDQLVVSKLADTKAAGEIRALEAFYAMLQTEPAKAYYGLKHVEKAVESQAVETLLLSDNLFRIQEINKRKRYVRLVDNVKESGGEVKIFSSMHVSGEQLSQLTGVAAILRFPMPEIEEDEEDETERE